MHFSGLTGDLWRVKGLEMTVKPRFEMLFVRFWFSSNFGSRSGVFTLDKVRSEVVESV